MAETLYQKHLRVYSEDTLRQMFRSEKVYIDYEKAEYKLRNAILDENTLLDTLIARDPSGLAKIELVKNRKEKNESVRSDTLRYMSETRKKIVELSNALQAHLFEYSNNEISSTGFVTHTIVCDYKAKLNDESKILSLDEMSKSEYGISNSLDRWRDSSKLKIFMRKKK